jgi:hypothetical protein
MNDLTAVDKGADWRRLKSLVLDSVCSPITNRVYNLGLDEFFAWYGQEPRPGFTKATAAAGALPWKRAGRAQFPSTCGSRLCGNWRLKPPITACWHPN